MERTVADRGQGSGSSRSTHEAKGFDLTDTVAETHKTAGSPPTSRESIFDLKDVSVRYSGNLAVADVSVGSSGATRSPP